MRVIHNSRSPFTLTITQRSTKKIEILGSADVDIMMRGGHDSYVVATILLKHVEGWNDIEIQDSNGETLFEYRVRDGDV